MSKISEERYIVMTGNGEDRAYSSRRLAKSRRQELADDGYNAYVLDLETGLAVA